MGGFRTSDPGKIVRSTVCEHTGGENTSCYGMVKTRSASGGTFAAEENVVAAGYAHK